MTYYLDNFKGPVPLEIILALKYVLPEKDFNKEIARFIELRQRQRRGPLQYINNTTAI